MRFQLWRTFNILRSTSNVLGSKGSGLRAPVGSSKLDVGRWTFPLFLSAALLTSRGAEPVVTNAIPTLAALRSNFTARVEHPRLAAAQLGVKIVSLDTGKTLFEHNAGKLLKPASNAKPIRIQRNFQNLKIHIV